MSSHRRHRIVLVSWVALAAACTSDTPPTATSPATRDLRYSASASSTLLDTFDSLSTARWTKSTGATPAPVGDARFRTAYANVARGSGKLSLQLPARSFDSGQIQSVNRYGYGLYQALMKCPSTDGAYCTFYSYYKTDEIDIEIYRLKGKWSIDMIAWRDGSKLSCGAHDGQSLRPAFDPSSAYHVYGYDYRSSELRFFIDGRYVTLPRGRCTRNLPRQAMTLLLAAWRPSYWNNPKSPPTTASTMLVDAVSFQP